MCFAKSLNATEAPDFHAPVVHAMHVALPITMIFKHFPLVQWIMNLCPPSLAVYLNPQLKGLLNMREVSQSYLTVAYVKLIGLVVVCQPDQRGQKQPTSISRLSVSHNLPRILEGQIENSFR